MPAKPAERIRDAERSREAILAAAETFFADHGYEGASLGEIAASAGLSRGTPSYFFGSKEQLYREVLDHTFSVRDAATRAAFAPLEAWCAGTEGRGELEAALAGAVTGYMGFLLDHRAFVKLVTREGLVDGESLHARRIRSTAMQDAFGRLASVAAARGLKAFVADDAVVLFVSLTFTPITLASTFMRAVGRDLRTPAVRRAHETMAVDQLMHFLTG